jgi:peptide-methionine (S)-S-oxide reductase
MADINLEIATFGAGCFWGVEHILKSIKGVVDTEVGFMGGDPNRTTYQEVCHGETGHAEVVQVTFNSKILTYKDLLGYFWRLHNPTTLNRQGLDIGSQYRSVIFYHTDEQKQWALESKEQFNGSGVFEQEVVTEIRPLMRFFKAEEYHQDYIDKGPGRFCHSLRDR